MDIPNEFWAALTGGFLSLLGGFLTARWQHRTQTIEREKIAKRFFYEQAVHVKELVAQIDTRFEKEGLVWFEYIEQIQTAFDTLNRNIESLVFVESEDIRKGIRSYFSKVYYAGQRAKFWQQQIYQIQNAAKNPALPDAEKTQMANNLRLYQSEAKNAVLEMRNAALEIEQLRQLLKD